MILPDTIFIALISLVLVLKPSYNFILQNYSFYNHSYNFCFTCFIYFKTSDLMERKGIVSNLDTILIYNLVIFIMNKYTIFIYNKYDNSEFWLLRYGHLVL